MGKNIKKLKRIELVFLVIVLTTAIIVVGKYIYPTVKEQANELIQTYKNYRKAEQRKKYNCPENLITIQLLEGKVCREQVDDSPYRKVFDTYNLDAKGKEQLYSLISEGTIKDADSIMNNIIPIDRYDPLNTNGSITWTEDPYKEQYWRFLFYGFRPMRHLFYAFDVTGDKKYLDKANEITLSFIDQGIYKPGVWLDFHAVSFRSMFLVKLWWELRENNSLTYEINEKLLKAIEKHADFLSDPNHYDKGYNHGLTEAVALYITAINFPDLPQAESWRTLSTARISDGLNSGVGNDGVLVENSPYYHFYTLEKYWEIYQYSRKHGYHIGDSFENRVRSMVSYATNILQPDQKIPLLGASIDRKIFYSSTFRDIAAQFPMFKYVLTSGKQGSQPKELNQIYPDAGQVILRSGWGYNKKFSDETQVVFDSGPYRTDHSDLDALTFNLYAKGKNLITDTGLFTYENNEFRDYFHGTAGHNTVVVDDLDQAEGAGYLGELVEDKKFASISGSHQLYKDVEHKRNISLIDKNTVLIIDKLSSNKEHTYKQIFHLFPGAVIKTEGTTVHVYDSEDTDKEPIMTILQVIPENISLDTYIGKDLPLRGYCSVQYEKLIPCYSVEYSQKSKDGFYITLIKIDPDNHKLNYKFDNNVITIENSNTKFSLSVSETEGVLAKVIATPPRQPELAISRLASLDSKDWEVKNGILAMTNEGIKLTADNTEQVMSISQKLNVDLTERNIILKLRIPDRLSIERLELILSSNNYIDYASSDVKFGISKNENGNWLTITLGKGKFRTSGGQWKINGSFDWSKIDGIKINFKTKDGKYPAIEFGEIGSVSTQEKGKVVIIFDDGYESILPAADIMKKNNIKGNIAVIANNAQSNQKGYLSTKQLKAIHQELGWDIVNHSELHKDAVLTYYDKNQLDLLEKDLLAGLHYLSENGINTAPNWYVYPHGSTNKKIKEIVGKYYTFARSTINQPEAFPFGEPLAVKTISADSSETSGKKIFTPVGDLVNAVQDADKYGLPLFITFHRIQASPTDSDGYSIKEFERFIKFISGNKINVLTLSEFDNSNKVNITPQVIIPGTPSQLKISARIEKLSLIRKILIFLQLNENKKSINIGYNHNIIDSRF